MTPREMAEAAVQALTTPGTLGVVLDVTRGGLPRGFPRGELLNERQVDGRFVRRTYSFDPQRVIAWLVVHGLIQCSQSPDGQWSIVEPEEAPDAVRVD